jgi:hypothetical protein
MASWCAPNSGSRCSMKSASASRACSRVTGQLKRPTLTRDGSAKRSVTSCSTLARDLVLRKDQRPGQVLRAGFAKAFAVVGVKVPLPAHAVRSPSISTLVLLAHLAVEKLHAQTWPIGLPTGEKRGRLHKKCLSSRHSSGVRWPGSGLHGLLLSVRARAGRRALRRSSVPACSASSAALQAGGQRLRRPHVLQCAVVHREFRVACSFSAKCRMADRNKRRAQLCATRRGWILLRPRSSARRRARRPGRRTSWNRCRADRPKPAIRWRQVLMVSWAGSVLPPVSAVQHAAQLLRARQAS